MPHDDLDPAAISACFAAELARAMRAFESGGRVVSGFAEGLAPGGGLRPRNRNCVRTIHDGSVALAGERMILAIDAGNSRVKWGWHDGAAWTSLATVSLIEFAAANHDINPFAATHENPERIVISNVAGEGAHQLLINWTSVFDAQAHWLRGEAERCGVTSRYERPEQLGPDRWAALVASRALHAGPCLVVNAGTATTADVLSAQGVFEGGVILPGIDLMRFVLHEHTGRLPLQEGTYVRAPRNTVDAIETGCRHAQAGAVERMFRLLGAQAQCIVSGGGGPALIEKIEGIPCRFVDTLVLEGLARIALDESTRESVRDRR